VQACIGVDKRQILTLRVGESLCGATQTGHPIQLCIQASSGEEAGMNVRYRVELSQAEREELTGLLSGGKHSVRKLKRAQILLAADAGVSDEAIANSVGVGGSTVYRTKRRFVLGNLEAALSEEPRRGAERKLSGKEEALRSRRLARDLPRVVLVGLWSCWRANWSSSPSTAASRGKRCAGDWPKTTSSHGARTCGVFRRSTANMWPAWRMCSTSTQNGPIRSAQWSVLTRVRPNSLARSASRSHRRLASLNATIASINAMEQRIYLSSSTCIDPGGRSRSPTAGRAWTSPLACASLTDVDFPTAERIRVVLDNLSTHSPGALYQAFPACEARRVLRRLEFHYVPKHASWLNMVEIEIGVLRGQCLDRRIATKEELKSEIAAWQRRRNASGARIKRMFTTETARTKMGRAYPQLDTVLNPPPKTHNHCAAVDCG
jgi:hypothetical protein